MACAEGEPPATLDLISCFHLHQVTRANPATVYGLEHQESRLHLDVVGDYIELVFGGNCRTTTGRL